MARLPRLSVPGLPHHLIQRGHDGRAVFLDDTDRRRYLQALLQAATDHGVAVHAYVLLDHEVHLLATPVAAHAIGRLVQALGRRYAAAFNQRRGRRGTLWDGRYRCSVLEPAVWTLPAMCVIEHLAQDHGLVVQARDWSWSSLRHHLGQCRDPLVTDPDAYWNLGNTPFEREAAYRQRFEVGVGVQARQQLLGAASKGWALGSADFLVALAGQVDRPLQPRPRGRPRCR